ncbi:hypothetical protein ACSU6B_17155 [Neobacillus sp. C211]|uniref:hypothetical protein n=1 Tax=unclassified Neobacillus TaxID=2675272 RepID=UPI00397B4EF2
MIPNGKKSRRHGGWNCQSSYNDNLDRAKELMDKAFNGHVQIFTITNPKALPLIDGIKANIKLDTPSYSKLSSDINTLVKMMREK